MVRALLALSFLFVSLCTTSSFKIIKNNQRTLTPTRLGDGWSFGKDIVKGLNGLFAEKEKEVLWLPFIEDGNLNGKTLIMYLTFYLGVTKKDDWIGLGTWRIRPEDANRNLSVGQESPEGSVKSSDAEEKSFRMMFMERMPKGVFGTADLKFEICTGSQPGLRVTRFRPSQTPGSRQGEVELIELVIENLEQIANDDTIQPENRIFETFSNAFSDARELYVVPRKQPM